MYKQLAIVAYVVLFCGCVDQHPALVNDIQSMQASVNEHRLAQGCAPLIWNAQVAAVAQAHSVDMAKRAYLSHTNPQGQSFADRVLAKGLEYQRVAENLAAGSSDVQVILAGWLASPGHRANIENCTLTHHGLGLSQTYWTHLFYTPQTP